MLLEWTQRADRPVVYWAGAAWSKGPDFKTAAEWEAYLQFAARRIAAPITVAVEAR